MRPRRARVLKPYGRATGPPVVRMPVRMRGSCEQTGQHLALGDDVGVGDHERARRALGDAADRAQVVSGRLARVQLGAVGGGAHRVGPGGPGQHVQPAMPRLENWATRRESSVSPSHAWSAAGPPSASAAVATSTADEPGHGRDRPAGPHAAAR